MKRIKAATAHSPNVTTNATIKIRQLNEIWYIAVEKYGPNTKDDFGWEKYKNWSKLHHLTEVISLDSMLCTPITDPAKDEDWNHIVNEDYMIYFYTDLQYLKSKISNYDKEDYNILAVIREPDNSNRHNQLHNFEFIGYDLMDREMFNSALTNCGGFDETFKPKDLNEFGLISNINKAFDTRKRLIINNPNEHHADCWVFEIWREMN